jgi:hypothetical protein
LPVDGTLQAASDRVAAATPAAIIVFNMTMSLSLVGEKRERFRSSSQFGLR